MKPKQDIKTVRQFGIILGIILIVIGILKIKTTGLWVLLILGVLTGIVALIAPKRLSGIYKVWMLVGGFIGNLVFQVLLALIFYLIITPIGLIKRVGDKSHKPGETESYWQRKEQDSDLRKMY